ncbi:hypothetical protein ACFLU2_01700 [Chloroflexota bacterium]
MSSIERRLTRIRAGTSASPLFDFLTEFGKDPYREFVQYRLKSFSTRQLQDAALDDWAVAADMLGLPFELEVLARFSAVLRSRYLITPTYWTGPITLTCAEAFTEIISTLENELDLGPILDKKIEEISEGRQRALLTILMSATNLFAGLASESRLIRKHMGMRKGIFG